MENEFLKLREILDPARVIFEIPFYAKKLLTGWLGA